jgi:hypothetical protein
MDYDPDAGVRQDVLGRGIAGSGTGRLDLPVTDFNIQEIDSLQVLTFAHRVSCIIPMAPHTFLHHEKGQPLESGNW